MTDNNQDDTGLEDVGVPAPEGAAQIIDTDYEIGQDNIETRIGPFGVDIHNPVFVISGAVIVLFVLFTLIFPDTASSGFSWLFSFVTQSFDWLFLSVGNIFVPVRFECSRGSQCGQPGT